LASYNRHYALKTSQDECGESIAINTYLFASFWISGTQTVDVFHCPWRSTTPPFSTDVRPLGMTQKEPLHHATMPAQTRVPGNKRRVRAKDADQQE
jgi:hypothetical protein